MSGIDEYILTGRVNAYTGHGYRQSEKKSVILARQRSIEPLSQRRLGQNPLIDLGEHDCTDQDLSSGVIAP